MAQSRSRSEPPNWLPEQVSRIRYYAIPAPASPSASRRCYCWMGATPRLRDGDGSAVRPLSITSPRLRFAATIGEA